MQIRLIRKWKTYVKGDRTILNDTAGQALVDAGIAIDESNLRKSLDSAPKDKMIRKANTK